MIGGSSGGHRPTPKTSGTNDPYADQARAENNLSNELQAAGDKQRAYFAAKDQAWRDAGYR